MLDFAKGLGASRWLAIAALAALGLGALAAGSVAASDLATVSVPQLADLLAQGAPVAVCDANNEKTRTRYGVIPGARLLSHYKDYDIVSELPADKAQTIVFYCANAACSAAPSAARQAAASGYTDVRVLTDGIQGWVKAGQKVEKSGI
jgi:rhodanese-related sulfurtransferase